LIPSYDFVLIWPALCLVIVPAHCLVIVPFC
jgi:hypothetical protein